MVAGMTKYAAFISYSHADQVSARWLHQALETYRLPRALIGTPSAFGPVPRRLPPVFRDRDGKVQAAGAIVGAVMKATGGKADAARVRELILERVTSKV